jgi:hypothetical protein
VTSRAPIAWLDKPEKHSYAAAESYLTLLHRPKPAAKLVAELRRASIIRFKAKDIFRASQLSLLGISNLHCERDRVKIKARTPLSPILLVRDEGNGRVVIADGYHRLCAVYALDEDAWIPCKIV